MKLGLRGGQDKRHKSRQPTLMEGQNDVAFRRSRTLTGSAASGVRSAVEDRSRLQSARVKSHKLRRHQKLLSLGLVGTVAIIAGLAWLVSQFIVMPSSLRYEQPIATKPNTGAYTKSINEYFVTRPTERFLFHLNQANLSAFVQEDHPEVKQVSIDMTDIGKFDVAVTFREPVLSWKVHDKLLYVDDEGTSFYVNNLASPDVAIEDNSGIRPEAVGALTSDRFVRFLGQIVDKINSSTVGPVEKAIIPAGTTRQVDITLKGRGYVIKTHIDRDPNAQAEDIINALQFIDQRGIAPQYVDCRVEGKAYYRT